VELSIEFRQLRQEKPVKKMFFFVLPFFYDILPQNTKESQS